ncbi:MAG: hypothetical protein BVN35_17965 [Proteobacteria bacterium ST_bin11]|jgi:hypothetical protein|nr:MAG: hypothetical protein BVN35_17965 [Proteobacteria bacterium ST_bin11]
MPQYQPLHDVLETLTDRLRSGEHVILSGHRRIGKTQLMQHLEANAPGVFLPTYLIVESSDTVDEFYRKLISHLVDQNFLNRWDSLGWSITSRFKSINIQELGKSVRFGDAKALDYHAEFCRLLEHLEPGRPIVMMLDEFPQTLENIRENEGVPQVRKLLTTQRELRQEPRYKGKIQFLYAGSIGLQNVVEGMGFTKHINDLREVKMRPFRREEALGYTRCLLQRKGLQADAAWLETLLDRIDWLAPFYISLLIDELHASPLEEKHIDEAFQAMIGHRHNFEHWHNRLKPQALSKEEYRFCKTLLSLATDPDRLGIDYAEACNLAVQHDVMDEVSRLLNILQHDGYLARDAHNRFRFISPVLRAWWWKEIAN